MIFNENMTHHLQIILNTPKHTYFKETLRKLLYTISVPKQYRIRLSTYLIRKI